MAGRNPSGGIKAVQTHKADSWAASAHNSSGVDTRGFEHATVLVNFGDSTASGSCAIKVQESSDDSTYADVSGATFTAVTTANDNAIYAGALRLHNRLRYLRVVATQSTDTAEFATTVVLNEVDVSSRQSVTYTFDV